MAPVAVLKQSEADTVSASAKSAGSTDNLLDMFKEADKEFKFRPIRESTVNRAMTSRYFADMDKYAESDVVIVGAGSCGLSAAFVLASSRPDLKIAIIEAGVAPGGGAWLGGMRGLDMNSAEDAIVRNTREIVPGIFVGGMELSEWDGANRMGPTFGAMALSGVQAAESVLRAFAREGAVKRC